MNKERTKVSLPILFFLILVTMIITFITTFVFLKKDYNKKFEKFSLIDEINELIDRDFYKGSEKEALIDRAVAGYVDGLEDVYSHYQTPQQYKVSTMSNSGSQIGIGVSVRSTEKGYIHIIEVNPDTPAQKANLKADDIILSVNGKDVAEYGFSESIMMIKSGNEGDEYSLSIERDKEVLAVKLKLEKMDIISSTGEMLEDNIAYIKISRFTGNTFSQYNELLNDFLKKGAKSIIFDVRDNGGGLVTSVEDCLDPLLPEGEVAFAKYKNGEKDIIVVSDENEINIPMVVLMNENTASGGELFSASLRDFKNAKLIGKNSFGKGIMQNTYPLSNGGSLTLTVATYQTTKSECYHGVGLAPDVEVELIEDNEDDEQLQKAIELLTEK